MIHSTAIIDKTVKIGKNVQIGPYSVITGNVSIGEGTKIGPCVVINTNTSIGKNCNIFQYAAIGAEPQAIKFGGEEVFLEIGDNVTIREFATLHRGTKEGGSITKIGSSVLLMAYSHIAHDCIIGDGSILSNCANLAGHVVVGKKATIGGLVGVHQFVRIGDYAFIAGKSTILKDVPPYMLAAGEREGAKLFGLNVIGLQRNNFNEETISELKKLYKIIFREDLLLEDALKKAETEIKNIPEKEKLIQFIKDAKRGITKDK